MTYSHSQGLISLYFGICTLAALCDGTDLASVSDTGQSLWVMLLLAASVLLFPPDSGRGSVAGCYSFSNEPEETFSREHLLENKEEHVLESRARD